MSTPYMVPSPIPQMNGYRVGIVRTIWIVLAIIGVGSFVVRLPGHYAYLQRACSSSLCSYGQLNPEAVQSFQALGVSLNTYADVRLGLTVAVAFTWFVVATVLAWRRSNDTLALLVALWFIVDGIATITGAFGLGRNATTQQDIEARAVNYLAEFGPFLLVFALFPARRSLARFVFWLQVAVGFFIVGPFQGDQSLKVMLQVSILVGLGFAQVYHYWDLHTQHRANLTHRQPSAWHIVAIALIGALSGALLIVLPAGGSLPSLIFYADVTAAAVIQLARYLRVATPIQRQQSKWALFVLSVFTSLSAVLLAPPLFMPSLGLSGAFYQTIHTLVLITISALMPFAIAFAIMRYHLWDIDILINKALVYGSLTGFLAAIYVAIVLGLDNLLVTVSGQASEQAVIVVATLTIAALFQPLRQGIQGRIDQRFYRRKYDMAKTLSAFGVTLRSEVDLSELRDQLLSVVDETMHPKYLSLWLRNVSVRRGSEGES